MDALLDFYKIKSFQKKKKEIAPYFLERVLIQGPLHLQANYYFLYKMHD